MKENMKTDLDLNLIPENTPAEEYEVYNQWGTYYYSEDMHNLEKYDGASSVAFDERADRGYMMTFVGCLRWGFLVNLLTCFFLKDILMEYTEPEYISYVIFPLPFQILAVGLRLKTKSTALHMLAYNLLALPLGFQTLYLAELISPIGGAQAVQTVFLGLLVTTAAMYVVALIKPDLYLFTGRTFAVTLISAAIAVVTMLIVQGIGFVLLGASLIVVGSAVYYAFLINRAVTRPKKDASAVTVAFDVYLKVLIALWIVYQKFLEATDEDEIG